MAHRSHIEVPGAGNSEATRAPANSRGHGLVSVAIFLFSAVAALGWYALYLHTFALPPQPSFSTPFDGYSTAPMQRAVTPEKVGRQHAQILGLGNRFLGDSGFYAMEQYLEKSYRDAGLEIYEQEITTLSPLTRYRELYLVDPADSGADYGKHLEEVAIFPFLPNFLQPPVTPESGIVGELVLLTSQVLKRRKRFDDCIGLVDVREGLIDRDYGFHWTRYARLGVRTCG